MNMPPPELVQPSAPGVGESAGPLKASLGDVAGSLETGSEHANVQTTGSTSIFSFRPAMNRKTTVAAALGVLGVGALAYFFSSARSGKAA